MYMCSTEGTPGAATGASDELTECYRKAVNKQSRMAGKNIQDAVEDTTCDSDAACLR
jgi:hypothetical protein